jgi:hypothetical protein
MGAAESDSFFVPIWGARPFFVFFSGRVPSHLAPLVAGYPAALGSASHPQCTTWNQQRAILRSLSSVKGMETVRLRRGEFEIGFAVRFLLFS